MICFVFSLLVKVIRKILVPFSLLYGLITTIRNFLYTNNVLKSTKFKTPTIVVGNLSVGGTGKTPQIEYLIRLLQNHYKIAVLSRGYKRKSKGFVLADEFATAETIGDEPFQFYKKFKNVIVCVDANRTNGIQQLEKLKTPPDIILLDDAFQHRKVQGGFNILLTSYNNLYVDDFMLPTGNLRETKFGANRAQAIIVTKCPETLSVEVQQTISKKLKPASNQPVFFTTITYDETLKGSAELALQDLINTEILLITGIANPVPLINYLRKKEVKFKQLNYPDHYHFKDKDINEIQQSFNAIQSKNKIVLTTEKDYVRIFDRLKNVYYISIKTTFITNKNSFDTIVNNYVGKSSGHR
ncbi:lipid-A-disaccharide kinase [Lutibacter agarilyticus]|uniref:Tetraacyldisaccharide 4'-kinase n=1 Tax=Lutibacter agarilyticus TaxID=1109740 RepID=A0A238X1W0_9FLAO|nr:lipid-A-disaccharide kinase [Lutibacter agarilyticus]